MKLKLDLHPIYSDTRQIDAALRAIIDEACEKRASEIEIIPGKGSGALKKSVLRFLDRPEVKARYHRVEKDSDNWGRLFVHFRWDRTTPAPPTGRVPKPALSIACFCCGSEFALGSGDDDDERSAATLTAECPSCGSPNRATIRVDRRGRPTAQVEPGYDP